MKKAKEYAELILSHEDKDKKIDEALEAVKSMIDEIVEIAEIRNVKKNSALKSIIKEQEQKWKAICNRVNSTPEGEIIRTDAFMNLLFKFIPSSKELFRGEKDII